MMSDAAEVTKRLRHGSLTLLAGQGLLDVYGIEPVIEAQLSERAMPCEPGGLYEAWLKTSGSEGVIHAWREVGDALSLSPALLAVARLQWSAVLTSGIDSVLKRALTTNTSRDVHVVFPRLGIGRFRAVRDPLTLVTLFGSVDRPVKEELPPTSRAELAGRRGGAAALLSSLSEVIGPRGVLIVEGWRPAKDWLRARELSLSLFGLLPGQVQIFSCDEKAQALLQADEDFAGLIDSGVVECHHEAFFEFLQELEARGELPPGWESEGADVTGRILVRGLKGTRVLVDVPPSSWRRYQREFVILTNEYESPGSHRTDAEKYEAFRDLLRSPQLHHHWQAVRELGVRRHFVDELLKKTISLLKDQRPQDKVILLEGQAGSGKSVGLAQLALDIRREGFPVIYVPSGTVEPSPDTIDRFCMFVENAVDEQSDYSSTALIWDGLRQPADYAALSGMLAARGRRVLVIGSTYRVSDAIRKSERSRIKSAFTVVSAKIRMLPNEQQELRSHLGRLIPEFSKRIDEYKLSLNSNFLVVLYHLLPEVRGPIDSGLLRELRVTEEQLRIRIDEAGSLPFGPNMQWQFGETTIGAALISALKVGFPWLLQPLSTAGSASDRVKQFDDAEKLLAIVLCAGQFGISIPQTLVLRCLDPQSRYAAYQHVMAGDFDILEDVENADGSFDLQPRQALEAKVIVSQRYTNPKDQLEIIKLLVRGLRDSDMVEEGTPALDCVVRLLRHFGPGEFEASASNLARPEFWPELANSVRELGNELTLVNARLLLLEAHFRREWVRRRQNQLFSYSEESAAEWEKMFAETRAAEVVVRRAIEQAARGESRERASTRRFLSFLNNELACVLGTRQKLRLAGARALDVQGDEPAEIDSVLFSKAQAACREGRSLWEDNGHILGSEFWITRDYVLDASVTDAERQSLIAELCDIFDEASTIEMTPEDSFDLNSRRYELTNIIDSQKAKGILSEIEKSNPCGAAVLRVRGMVGGLLPTAIEPGLLAAALEILDSLGPALYRDRKALLLYSRLWWRFKTGIDFFAEERICPKFSKGDWRKLEDIMSARLGLAEDRGRAFALFHRAWARVQLREVGKGQEDFQEIARLGVGGARRALALAIVGDEDGRPINFRGEVRKILQPNRGFAWISELALEVAFNPLEMVGNRVLRRFESLGEIQLALNYRGLYALPVDRFRRGGPSQTA